MKGFTLVEVLVAMALIAVTGIGLLELVSVSGLAVRDARADTVETLAAQSKMAELRALAWTFDAAGAPVTDTWTDTSVEPMTTGGAGLAPAGSLAATLAGYSDFVTSSGEFAGRGAAAAPRSAAYLRRWSISQAPFDPANTLVLQVIATRVGRSNARDVHLVSLLARARR